MEFSYQYNQSVEESDKKTLNFNNNTQKYDLLDTLFSTKYTNTFSNQRAEVKIQTRRDKYTLTLGLGVYPSYSLSETQGKDDLSQNVINLAPSANFNYNWSKTQTMRAFYWGSTNQPSINQLQPTTDNSDPLNITLGNPDLKPEFRHRMNVFYNNFSVKTMRSMMAMAMFTITQNKINNSTFSQEGITYSLPENTDVAYTFYGMFMYNTPIGKSKFSVATTTNLSYNENENKINFAKNISKTTSASENLRFSYRGKDLTFGLALRGIYNITEYSLLNTKNNYTDFILTPDASWKINSRFTLSSDLAMKRTWGYSSGYNQDNTAWNADLSWSFLKNRNGTLRLKVFDILDKQQNTTRTIDPSYIEDVTYNTIGRYFMFSFIYNFNPSTSSRSPNSDANNSGGFRPGGGGMRFDMR